MTIYKWYFDSLESNQGGIIETTDFEEPEVDEALWILVKCEKYVNGVMFLMYDPFRNVNHLPKKYH